MKKISTSALMLLAFSFFVSASASETTSGGFLPAGASVGDAVGLTRLMGPQLRALERDFPNSKILSTCRGNYSGNSPDELVLTVTSASDTARNRAISRVGLTFSDNEWSIHRIDVEIKMDSAVSHASHIDEWDHPADPEKFAKTIKCNVVLNSDKTFSQNGKLLGRPPFFKLAEMGKRSVTNACFSSSAEYNNWDCVAYDARQRRFRLWYQQVFAD
jgi:hypothetical protein